jgi:hypothetical protein
VALALTPYPAEMVAWMPWQELWVKKLVTLELPAMKRLI